MRKTLISFVAYLLLTTGINHSIAQTVSHKSNVLFIGNSYTYTNDLPGLTALVAASAGDTLIYDSHTIGGYTLEQHASDTTTLRKISEGIWNYVVLQEQSQLPSFPIGQVDTFVFPYAKFLDSVIRRDNACGRSMFYMTWGKEYGDTANCPTWPPVCTYDGMDSMLYLRYMMMADSNAGVVSPVGAVRHYIIDHYPSIQLYISDQSHPTQAGTYAAACTFYTAIFKRDPTLITYNYTLTDTDAAHIREAAQVIAYDSLTKWHIGQYYPIAGATYTVSSGSTTFTNNSTNALNYFWNFGDGLTSLSTSPSHTYTAIGTYTVAEVAINCNVSDTTYFIINISSLGMQNVSLYEQEISVIPNPTHDIVTIKSSMFLSGNYAFKLTNTIGQTVSNTETNGNEATILDLKSLDKGVYFLSIAHGGQVVYRGKVVKD